MTNKPLVITFQGLLQILDVISVHWLSTLRIGLYSNPIDPDIALVIGQLEPTTFSGYSGLRSFATWTAPAIDGVRAVTTNGLLIWTHDGGPVADWVAGYYVVDPDGALVFLAAGDDPPVLMAGAGQVYQVNPQFSQRTERAV